MTFPRTCALLALLLLAACNRQPPRTPEAVRAELARRMPAGVADRAGWARDIQTAMAAQEIAPTSAHLCAVLAVVAQESGFRADPPVPGLGRIARAEIGRRAAVLHVPGFVVDAALQAHAPDGQTYAQHLAAVRTEQELSELFEQLIGRVPLGARLLAGLNPVHTAGPMQVDIGFAQAHAGGYPYPRDGSIRHEVFTRRGGLYFGIRHLLGYPVRYTQMLHRFADFNAGWYASRNAAFQAAVEVASGQHLARDGDLVRPGASLQEPGDTERAVRALRPQLGMDDAAIRRALQRSDTLRFEDTPLYARVFALAETRRGRALPRTVVPEIALRSPKLSRKLSTSWFAYRVNERYRACLARP